MNINMNFIDSEQFQLMKKRWNPHLRMEKTNEYASKLNIHNYYGKFAFAQLTYLDLPFDSLNELAHFIDADRMNWDSSYSKDMATLLSILSTNRIYCSTWEDLKKLFNVYTKNWKSRFLISLFCEACSKKGYLGHPLYQSELFGYTKNERHQSGFLDIINDCGLNSAFKWMHERMLVKLKNRYVKRSMENAFNSKDRCKVYPFLVYGSRALESKKVLEKHCGMNRIFNQNVPHECREEIFIMVICCFSTITYSSQKYYDHFLSRVTDPLIKGIIHFGADTSFRISPLFSFLQSEIGHILYDTFRGKAYSKLVDETSDAITRETYGITTKLIKSDDKELDFTKIWANAPPDMIESVCNEFDKVPLEQFGEMNKTHYKAMKNHRMTIYDKLLGAGSEEIDSLLDIAYSMFRLNLANEAEKILQKVLEIDPNNLVACINLGKLFFDSSRMVEAKQKFQSAIRIDPENPVAYRNLGLVLNKLGEFNEAEKMLRKANTIARFLDKEVGLSDNLTVLYEKANDSDYQEKPKNETKFDEKGQPVCNRCHQAGDQGSTVCKWCKKPY